MNTFTHGCKFWGSDYLTETAADLKHTSYYWFKYVWYKAPLCTEKQNMHLYVCWRLLVHFLSSKLSLIEKNGRFPKKTYFLLSLAHMENTLDFGKEKKKSGWMVILLQSTSLACFYFMYVTFCSCHLWHLLLEPCWVRNGDQKVTPSSLKLY